MNGSKTTSFVSLGSIQLKLHHSEMGSTEGWKGHMLHQTTSKLLEYLPILAQKWLHSLEHVYT